MKNYYEILEVDKKASPEVIEKAYKVLVKKYHPDLQNDQNHLRYEEKMKEINEAYAILSDDYKKNNYDEQLQSTVISVEKYQRLLQENRRLKAQLENISNVNESSTNNNEWKTNNNMQNNNTISRMTQVMKENIKQAREQAYKDAYVQDMKNRGYTIKYQHDLKYYVKFTGCLVLVFLMFLIIYQIPIIKILVNRLFEENKVIQSLVSIFKTNMK